MARRSTSKEKKATKNSLVTLVGDGIKIEVRKYETGNMLGFATLIIDDEIYIYNCKIVDGKNGKFLSFPSYQGSDGKYYNYVYIDKDSDLINDIQSVVKAWDPEMDD